MFYEKVLLVLSLFHIVLQIYADWDGNGAKVGGLLLDFADTSAYPGLNVSNYADARKIQVCLLGIGNPASLFQSVAQPIQNLQIQITLDTQYVPVKLEPSSSFQQGEPSYNVAHDILAKLGRKTDVIHCGTDESGLKYYFGQGPEPNSIAVYADDRFIQNNVEVKGMFYNLNENSLNG